MVSIPRASRTVSSSLRVLAPAALLVALTVVPLSVFFWLLLFTDTFTIQAVTVVDARETTEDAVRTIVKRETERVALGTNIFFVPLDLLETAIQKENPEVRTVHTVRLLPGTLKIIIQEKQPALLLLSGGTYYFVDDEGVPYEEANLAALPGVVLPVVKNLSPENTVSLGVSAVVPEFVSLVLAIQDQLPDVLDAHVVEMTIPSLSAREVHARLSSNWSIKFDTERPVTAQLNALSRTVDEIITADELSLLEYVDLRIPNRVYYRTR